MSATPTPILRVSFVRFRFGESSSASGSPRRRSEFSLKASCRSPPAPVDYRSTGHTKYLSGVSYVTIRRVIIPGEFIGFDLKGAVWQQR